MNGIISSISESLRGLGARHPAQLRGAAPPAGASSYDAELLNEIECIGFHPFILMRTGGASSPKKRFITCRTQNQAGEFVQDLAGLPHFGASKLVRAIERALQLETYEAADLLFSWT